ncbi:NRDE family protein [Bacillus sp. FJAT-45350]|uniref:NRDE family protein n=1 Tax=Bacillus sp. FJAT-45350 TaxID=2011014 RepID=UPI000BB808C1|nr:NRDE family protein [Bacillus sp. FJAT-45350]
MCLVLFAYDTHQDYSLIIAANRDEFFARPTLSATFWEEAPNLLAGRDIEKSGTWMGVTKEGRFAAVTNVRDLREIDQARSRGELVSTYLKEDISPLSYLKQVEDNGHAYNGFNLLVGLPNSLYYFSNRQGRITEVTPGIHSLSNAALNTPWPKVEEGKKGLEKSMKIRNKESLINSLFTVLADDRRAPDEYLPNTGITLELERMLSSIMIKSDGYGTRSSTVYLLGKDGNVTYIERTFKNDNNSYKENKFQFTI